MCGVKQIGKYNVDYAGFVYDNNISYHMVIVDEFDENDKPTGVRKTFYFRSNSDTTEEYIMPDLSTEEKVDYWMEYPNHSKFQIYKTVIIERV